jgi:hypothetical protein
MNAALILVVAAGAGTTAVADDLTIVSKVTPAKGEPSTQTQYITPERMRMSDGVNDTVVDLAAGKLVAIDHKKKSYYETTFEEMQKYFAGLNEMLASNPMMETMMGKVADVQVQKTAETREIIGYTCTKYVLTMGEKFKETLWVTPEVKMPVTYYDASKMSYAMMGPMAGRFEKMLDEMKKIDGFPLARRRHEDDGDGRLEPHRGDRDQQGDIPDEPSLCPPDTRRQDPDAGVTPSGRPLPRG